MHRFTIPRVRNERVENSGVILILEHNKTGFFGGAHVIVVRDINMSRLTLSQIQNVLPAVATKYEHLLLEIESTDPSSIGLVIRYQINY